MAIKNIKKLGSETDEMNRIQDYISNSIDAIISSSILDGVLLQNVVLTSGLNELSHRLGRKPQGWIIVRKRANVDIWDSQDSNSKPNLTLHLQSSGNATVDIWIF